MNWGIILVGGDTQARAKYQKFEVYEANSNCTANEIEWLLLIPWTSVKDNKSLRANTKQLKAKCGSKEPPRYHP